ncbi:MAG: hypothetical protein PHF26_03495 [Candidatus Gracilibacteria bacterium]|nr:hypothetical protein [Candidatus Gracilibacteria bacterium]
MSTMKTSKVIKPTSKNIKDKEKTFSFKELAEKYKNGDKRHKPYFWGDEMRWRKDKQMWFVIPKNDSEWLEFAGKESDIEWR